MKLIDPTDDQLNVAFAEYVCGWIRRDMGKIGTHKKPDAFHSARGWECNEINPTQFTTSSDAVLPWLEKCYCQIGFGPAWRVTIEGGRTNKINAATHLDDSLPRAAAIALLRAHGVEVEFTKATP